jgi:hypothetical protein
MSEQIKLPQQQDLLQLIRATLKSKQTNKPSPQTKPTPPSNGKGVQKVKQQPRTDEHGKLGDFSRSQTNSPRSSFTSNTAIVGYEEVPRTRLSKTDERKGVVNAETEMIRKAIKLVLNQTGGAPSKRAAKRAAAPKMTRSDRVFKTTGPGSSRSPVLDRIKAIAAKETGCIVRKEAISSSTSAKNANTTQGNYNPMIVE